MRAKERERQRQRLTGGEFVFWEEGGKRKEERCVKETNDRKGKSRYIRAARERGPSSFTFTKFVNVSLLRDFFGGKKIKSTLFSLTGLLL